MSRRSASRSTATPPRRVRPARGAPTTASEADGADASAVSTRRQATPFGVSPVARAGAGLPPVVGLSAARERARWNQWDTDADLLNRRYAEAVEAVGGVPVLLPVPGDDTDAGLAVAA